MIDCLLFGHSQTFNKNANMWLGRTIGPYKIRAIAENNGLNTHLIDFCDDFSFEELKKYVDKYVSTNTKVLGISTTYSFFGTFSKKFNRDFFNYVKSKNSNIKIIIGGQNEKLFSYLKDSCGDLIDWCLTGYAEVGFDVLLKYLFNNGPSPIFNVDGKLKVIDCNNFYLDKTDFYQYPWKESDIIDSNHTLPVEIARGCIFDCGFCGFALRGKRANELVVRENEIYDAFMKNYENFGTTKYTFIDETYNDSLEKLEAVTRVVDRLPFKIQFTAYIKPDLLSKYPEMLDHLKYQGLVACSSGLESLNTETRRSVYKGIPREKIIEILEIMQQKFDYKLQLRVSLIAGLPNETPEMLFETHDWLTSHSHLIKCWDWYPLMLSTNTSSLVNKFSQNYSEYGYTINNPEYSYYWENSTNNMDFVLATQLAFILNKLRDEYLVGRFIMCGSDLGPSIPELIENSKLSEYNMDRAQQIFDEFITRYKQSR